MKIKKKLETDEDLDDKEANTYAETWFALADLDGNGLIDEKEFLDFCGKIDEKKSLSEQDMKSQFENHDS